MKFRNGFVSNSSTTSFVIIGWEADRKEIMDDDIVVKMSNGDGTIVISPDYETRELLKKVSIVIWNELYIKLFHSVYSSFTEEEEEVSVKKMIKSLQNVNRETLAVYTGESQQCTGEYDEIKDILDNCHVEGEEGEKGEDKEE